MITKPPSPPKPAVDIERWPVLEEEPEQRDEGDVPRIVCHIYAGIGMLCGHKGGNGVPRDPAFNLAGPRCDGPRGCNRRRCPRCAAVWAEHG